MVIETFRGHDAKSIYRRFRASGRLMPDGLEYITLLQRWIAEWSDLMAFEVVPVVAGADTAGALGEDSAAP